VEAEFSGILRHPRVFKELISDGARHIVRVQHSARIYCSTIVIVIVVVVVNVYVSSVTIMYDY
jgi:hypothetical protein